MDTFSFIPARRDDNRPKAIKLLERAIERDPNFVRAYCFPANRKPHRSGEWSQRRSNLRRRKRRSRPRFISGLILAKRTLALDIFITTGLANRYCLSRHTPLTKSASAGISRSGAPAAKFGRRSQCGSFGSRGQWSVMGPEALRYRRKAVQLEPRDPEPALGLADLYDALRRTTT